MNLSFIEQSCQLSEECWRRNPRGKGANHIWRSMTCSFSKETRLCCGLAEDFVECLRVDVKVKARVFFSLSIPSEKIRYLGVLSDKRRTDYM